MSSPINIQPVDGVIKERFSFNSKSLLPSSFVNLSRKKKEPVFSGPERMACDGNDYEILT